MLWYLNDASMQGQYVTAGEFEVVLRRLLGARTRVPAIGKNFRITRSISESEICPNLNVRQAVNALTDRDLKRATLSWFDKSGPFLEDDILHENDDYFEFEDVDVTDTGLGEAARRTKNGFDCASFSFEGGEVNFSPNPLHIQHGLPEEPLGIYHVKNICDVEGLIEQAIAANDPISSWPTLISSARLKYANLTIKSIETNPLLAREPFSSAIADSFLTLLSVLNNYVESRDDTGVETAKSQEIIRNYFSGDRARFSGESRTNKTTFETGMTFQTESGETYLAHWHGKISHRFFRVHFKWPLEQDEKKLEVFYLGPKLTKS